MAHGLIKQENGNYSIWSTVVDNFIVQDATIEEIYNLYKEEAILSSKDMVDRMITDIGNNKFTPNSIEEAKEIIKCIHDE